MYELRKYILPFSTVISFLVLFFYKKRNNYLYHFFGLVLMLIATYLLRSLFELLLLIFTVVYGLIIIFGYKFQDVLYKVVLFVASVIYLYQLKYSVNTITHDTLLMSLAGGVTITIGYVFALTLCGIDFKEKIPKDEQVEDKDKICAKFEGEDFVKFVK